MPDDRPDFIPHTQAATSGSRPDFIPHTDAAATTASTTDVPTVSGPYQARKGGPILDPTKSPLRTGVESLESGFGIKDPQSLGDAFKQFGSAFTGQVKGSYKDWQQGLS